MKKNILILSFISFVLLACQDYKPNDPVLDDFTIAVVKNGGDSLITESTVPVNTPIRIMVYTDADICTLWPAGKRNILKSKLNNLNDSIDVYGHVVLAGPKASDDYRDYGLFGAQGLVTSGSKYSYYSTTYTYLNKGTYELAVVLTNRGVDSPEYNQKVIKKTIIVK